MKLKDFTEALENKYLGASSSNILNESLNTINRQAAIDLWFKIFDRDMSGIHLLYILSKITGIDKDEITANAKEKYEANPNESWLSSISTDDIYKSLEEYGAEDEYPDLFNKIND